MHRQAGKLRANLGAAEAQPQHSPRPRPTGLKVDGRPEPVLGRARGPAMIRGLLYCASG
jgi:hypothetical protein